MSAALHAAALAYAEAVARYRAAFRSWQTDCPDESAAHFCDLGKTVPSDPRWQTEVAPLCRRANESSYALQAAAEAYAAEQASMPSPVAHLGDTVTIYSSEPVSSEACVDCGSKKAHLDRGEMLCDGCIAERNAACAEAF